MPILNSLDAREPSSIPVVFDPRWAVRSMFGGALAAVAVRAARAVLGVELPLSDAMFAFLAPVPAGPAELEVRRTRAGRRFAAADVILRVEGREALRASISFSTGVMPPVPREPVRSPSAGCATFDGDVEWWPGEDAGPGLFTSWVRATRPMFAADEWLCVAADILAPAVSGQARASLGGAFAVATAALTLTVVEAAAPTAWLEQSVSASLEGDVVSGLIDLRDASGRTTARASQRAALVPSGSEEPRLVTAFANSAIHSRLFGMN